MSYSSTTSHYILIPMGGVFAAAIVSSETPYRTYRGKGEGPTVV